MSNHYTTQYNHKQRVLGRVRSVFEYARWGKYAHKKVLDSLSNRVYNTNSWKRLTQYNKEYVRGVIDTEFRFIDQHEIEWAVYHKDHGHVRRGNYNVLDGKWAEVDGHFGAHFWKDSDKIWSADPDVFVMYDQNPEYGYRIEEVQNGQSSQK